MSLDISPQSLHDRIHNATPRETAKAASNILNHLQNCPPDIQLTGGAVVFLTLCRRFGAEPLDLIRAVGNMMKESRRYDDASFQGIQDYFDNEI